MDFISNLFGFIYHVFRKFKQNKNDEKKCFRDFFKEKIEQNLRYISILLVQTFVDVDSYLTYTECTIKHLHYFDFCYKYQNG